jgi:hypothetical protein
MIYIANGLVVIDFSLLLVLFDYLCENFLSRFSNKAVFPKSGTPLFFF